MERSHWVDVGIKLHVREWDGTAAPFVLLHGLSSNSQTWQQVARRLHAAGHRVVAVDQRGHGLSDKPDDGYDFETITADLAGLIDAMGVERPLVVGQSWGGNVVLAFGARFPGVARGLGFIDGGTIDFQSQNGVTWEETWQRLQPPPLAGTLQSQLAERIRAHNPDWSDEGIEATLGNFETLPDGTVRPWLTRARHKAILRALFAQRPPQLYPQVQEPVLICMADDGNGAWTARKRAQAEIATTALAQAEVHWFENTAHDIHVHRPRRLANLFLFALAEGIWQPDAGK